MSVMHDLYYGQLNPSNKHFNCGTEFSKHLNLMADAQQQLTQIFKDGGKKEEQRLLEQLVDALVNLSDITEYEFFLYGFRVGAGVMIETFVCPQLTATYPV